MALLTDTYRGRFAATTAPASASSHALRLAYRKSAAAGDTVDLRVQLRSADNATLIAEWLLSNIGDTYTEATLSLTGPQIAAIAAGDYTGGLIYVLQREGDSTATSSNNRSADVSWLEFGFIESTILTPPAASAGATTTAPALTVTQHVFLTPDAASAAATTTAPTLTLTQHVFLTPPAATAGFTTTAPALTVSGNVTLSVPAATVAATTTAPTLTVSNHVFLDVPSASASATTTAPTLTVSNSVFLAPPAATATATTTAPAITVSANVFLDVPAATAAAVTTAPAVQVSGSVILSPPAASAGATTTAPVVTVSGTVVLNVPAATAAATTTAPTVTVSNNIILTPGSATAGFVTTAPTLLSSLIPAPIFDLTGDYVVEHAVTGDYVTLIRIGGGDLNQNIPPDGEKWYAGDSKTVRISTQRTMTGALEVRFRIVGADVSKSLTDGITVEPNAIVVAFAPADTAGKPGSYAYECEAADASGNVGTEAQGRVILSENYI